MSEAWQHLAGLGAEHQGPGDTKARQEHWLFDCLRRNSASEYGKRYSFDTIHSVRDFQERVPVIAYADVEPHIQRLMAGEADVLFAGLPVCFERTGGSTLGSKLIPYSSRSLQDFQAALLPWLGNSIRQFDIQSGTAYFSISPATRRAEISPGGVPIGLPDGAYLGADALAEFGQISAVPSWAGGLYDVELWQLVTLYWLLRREDLMLISVWSPTFMLTLLDALEERSNELVELLQNGVAVSGHALAPDPAALKRLNQYLATGDSQGLWPNLMLVSCWADASSKPFFEQLKQRLGHATFQGKGLLSTESVVTVPDQAGRPVLAPDSGFFEFHADSDVIYTADELTEGAQYEVLITTSGGLYRYKTGDSVVCEGFVDSVPVLRFSGRKGLTCDIVGEKLNDDFVSSCLEGVTGFRMLVPVRMPKPGYVLVVDDQYEHTPAQLIDLIETRLCANPQYAYARRMGQLGKLSIVTASNPLDKYAARLANAGGRLGDLKVTALRNESDWLDTFAGATT